MTDEDALVKLAGEQIRAVLADGYDEETAFCSALERIGLNIERIATRLEQPSGMREALEATTAMLKEVMPRNGYVQGFRCRKAVELADAALSQQHKGDENA